MKGWDVTGTSKAVCSTPWSQHCQRSYKLDYTLPLVVVLPERYRSEAITRGTLEATPVVSTRVCSCDRYALWSTAPRTRGFSSEVNFKILQATRQLIVACPECFVARHPSFVASVVLCRSIAGLVTYSRVLMSLTSSLRFTRSAEKQEWKNKNALKKKMRNYLTN